MHRKAELFEHTKEVTTFFMERTIRTLREMKEKAESSFIENSIIVHGALDGPVPDPKADLEMIIELNQAISILQNNNASKESRHPHPLQ